MFLGGWGIYIFTCEQFDLFTQSILKKYVGFFCFNNQLGLILECMWGKFQEIEWDKRYGTLGSSEWSLESIS